MVEMHWAALSLFEVAGIVGGFLAGVVWMTTLTVRSMAVDPEWWHLKVTELQELHARDVALHRQEQNRT